MEVLVEYDYQAQNPDELTIKKGDKIRNVTRKEDGWFEGELVTTGKRGVFPDNFVKQIKSVAKPLVFNSSPDDKKKPIIPQHHPHPHHQQQQLQQQPQQPQPKPISSPPIGMAQFQAKVLYSYIPVNEDELSIQENDIVTVLRLVEDGWYEGVFNGKRGVFPSNYVEKLEKPDELASNSLNEFENGVKKKKVFGIGFGNIFSGKQIELKTKENFNSEPEPIKRIKAKVLYDYEPSQPDELKLIRNEIVYILDRNLEDEGWWKGENASNGKIGVFPDNFVQILDDEPTRKKLIETSGLNSAGSSTSSAASSSNNSLQREPKIMSPNLDDVVESERLTHLKKTRINNRRPPSFRSKVVRNEEEIQDEIKPPSPGSVLVSSVSSKDLQNFTLTQTKSPVQDDLASMKQEIDLIKQSSIEMQNEYKKVQNELVEVKRHHDDQMKKMQKKLNDLIFEIDEEKKTRLALQVELERLKKTIMLNS